MLQFQMLDPIDTGPNQRVLIISNGWDGLETCFKTFATGRGSSMTLPWQLGFPLVHRIGNCPKASQGMDPYSSPIEVMIRKIPNNLCNGTFIACKL